MVLYLPKDFALLGSSVLAQTGLVSNFFFWLHTGYFDPSSDTMPLLHTWSLAVEEQFYLLFPLLLVFLARHKRLPLRGIILFLCLGSFELSVLGSAINPQANFYLLPTRVELLIGALPATRRQNSLPIRL
jgi:peptidoglycan/LPS O-acetylase OafA/YrhL